jgi:hypothetical protein
MLSHVTPTSIQGRESLHSDHFGTNAYALNFNPKKNANFSVMFCHHVHSAPTESEESQQEMKRLASNGTPVRGKVRIDTRTSIPACMIEQ